MFWRLNLDDVPCTLEEMELAVDGTFQIGFFLRNPNVERGIAGYTGKHQCFASLGLFSL